MIRQARRITAAQLLQEAGQDDFRIFRVAGADRIHQIRHPVQARSVVKSRLILFFCWCLRVCDASMLLAASVGLDLEHARNGRLGR